MKKSFSLLVTLILITTFSFFAVFIIQTKSLSISNLTNSYLQSQAKLHLNFFKQYINTLDLKEKCTTELSFIDDIYNLKAQISFEQGCLSNLEQTVIIDIFINAKTLNNEINLHERVTKTIK